MIDEPRDNAPPDDADEHDNDFDDIFDDEISLDELEGDVPNYFGSADNDISDSGAEPPGFSPPAVDEVEPEAGDEFGDEVSYEELEGDAASFFEVYAAPATPPPPAPDVRGADSRRPNAFEVQAEPPPPPASQPAAAPTPPPQASTPGDADNIRRLHSVEVEVIATLGTTRMQIRDILGLQVGSVVELHRMVGEPVDVTLNGRLIARGEVVVVDEKFAIRVHEIAGHDE